MTKNQRIEELEKRHDVLANAILDINSRLDAVHEQLALKANSRRKNPTPKGKK